MHQSIMTKIKNIADKNWIVLDVIIMHSIKIFEKMGIKINFYTD